MKDEFDCYKKHVCVFYSNIVNIYTKLDANSLPKIKSLVNKLTIYQGFSTFDQKSAHYQVPLGKDDKPFTTFEANRHL